VFQEPKDRSLAVWHTWRSSSRGQTFERQPASVGDLDESNFGFRVEILHSFNPYRCEFTPDDIGHRFELDPAGKQSVHIKAMRRNCQEFEQLAMSFGEGFCGHFGFP